MTDGVDVSSITKSIETLLNDTQDLQQVSVSRGEPINDDPADCPWVGVYRRRHRYDPRTLGRGAGHRQVTADVVLVVQETHMVSGADCEDALDALVADVVGVILTDPSLAGSVDMTNEVVVSYDYDALEDVDEESHFFQTAFVELKMEGRTT